MKDPTIYHLLPNQRDPIVNTATPIISAYIFPKVGSIVDTSTLVLVIDGMTYTGLGTRYNFLAKQLVHTLASPLQNGNHTITLLAGANADTVNFTTQVGFVQLTNEFPFTTWKSSWTLYGLVQDTTVTFARIIRNGVDTFSAAVTNGSFSAIADSSGSMKISSPLVFIRRVNHSPYAVITFNEAFDHITLSALSSTDPDSSQILTFLWSTDSSNPEYIAGVDGATNPGIDLAKSATPGEYYFAMIATDSTGNADTTRNYFTLNSDKSFSIPTIASNPGWARRARIYFLFPKW